MLRSTENGKTACIHVKQAVVVVLESPLENRDTYVWREMSTSDPTVALTEPSADVVPIRGETRRVIRGLKPGTVTITSTRPPCTSDSPSQCPADQGWETFLVVSS